MLRSRIIPERGGDTQFSSMTAAYDALSGPMQSFLEGLTAVHDFAHGFRESLAEPGGRERLFPRSPAYGARHHRWRQTLLDRWLPPQKFNNPLRHPVSIQRLVQGRHTLVIVILTNHLAPQIQYVL